MFNKIFKNLDSSNILYSDIAKYVRVLVLEMGWKSGSAHFGGAFLIIDFLAVIFKNNLDDVINKTYKIIFSKGYSIIAYYAFLDVYKLIKREILEKYKSK